MYFCTFLRQNLNFCREKKNKEQEEHINLRDPGWVKVKTRCRTTGTVQSDSEWSVLWKTKYIKYITAACYSNSFLCGQKRLCPCCPSYLYLFRETKCWSGAQSENFAAMVTLCALCGREFQILSQQLQRKKSNYYYFYPYGYYNDYYYYYYWS